MDHSDINPVEWGKLLKEVENLTSSVTKLDSKIDVFLKDYVNRREFSDLQTAYWDTASELQKVKQEQSRGAWVERALSGLIAIAAAGLVSYFSGG